ncbi:MAG TPA: sigma-70 family RNA polymerase sigma factor [Polyangiaceae bacterium]|jgi:RNA polymerase sigma-70 factor (ECF subfamily)|nr:sigma-70 family RNA polymerase sigma factor [Polyangiaceae bacterium]
MSRSEKRAELEEFERAILTHAPNLLAVACRLARSRPEAEDLVQDTLVKALRAKEQYETGTNLKAWLLKILKNTFINRYRRSGLERSVMDGPEADPLADGWIGAATLRGMRDPESQAMRPVLEREISKALDAIPEEFRLVVVLADVEELSYREIADLVGCPIGTVMSRLHRGRRLLKTSLLEQARMMGLVPEASESTPDTKAAPMPAPVELESYRQKRNAR